MNGSSHNDSLILFKNQILLWNRYGSLYKLVCIVDRLFLKPLRLEFTQLSACI